MKRLCLTFLLTVPLYGQAGEITPTQDEYAALVARNDVASAVAGSLAAPWIIEELQTLLTGPQPRSKAEVAKLLAAHGIGHGTFLPRGASGKLPVELLDPGSLPLGGNPALARVPEPGSLILLGAGLICLALLRRRQYPAAPTLPEPKKRLATRAAMPES